MPSDGGALLPQPDATLDTFGRLCPVPIILTAKRMKTLDAGAVLAVLSDDRGILEDMPLWCRTSRNELISIEEIARGEWRALVRKGAHAR
jgi:TusA-related sulfurtransferase